MSNKLTNYKLIVTIVTKGMAKKVVASSKKAGAEGGTTLLGRGTGIHEAKKLLGICIDPEKEIILTLIDSSKADSVLSAIVDSGHLNCSSCGIAFVLGTKQIAGVAHLLETMQRRSFDGK
ncbi:MAG: P-II family nitrogen regulator [Clostridiales bacterium]|nr:P-II family nitrogen regulator [Clostridiales bacterium]